MDAPPPVRRLIALSFADSFVSDGFIKTKQQRYTVEKLTYSNKKSILLMMNLRYVYHDDVTAYIVL